MGLFDGLLSAITLGLVPSHDDRVGNKAQNSAEYLANQQANQFSNIYGQGQNLFTGANTSLNQTQQSNPLLQLYQTGQSNNPLLQAYAQAAGINLPGVSTPPGFIPGTPGGGFTNGAPNVVRDPRTGGATIAANGATSPGGVANPAQAGNMPNQANADPYGLTQPQRVQLNQELDKITKRAQSHISQFTARMNKQGVSPQIAAEGAARLQAEYDSMAAGAEAAFAENARAAKEQALGGLLQSGQSAYNQQTGLLEALLGQGLGTSLSATTGLTNPQGAQNQIAQQAGANQSAVNNLVYGALANYLGGLGGVGGGGISGVPQLGGMGDTPMLSASAIPNLSSLF